MEQSAQQRKAIQMSRTIKDMPATLRAAERNRIEVDAEVKAVLQMPPLFANREAVEAFFSYRTELVGAVTEEDFGAPNTTAWHARQSNRKNRHDTKAALRRMDLDELDDLCLDEPARCARWDAT